MDVTARAADTTGARPTWPGVLSQLLAAVELDSSQTDWAMSEILAGAASDAQIAGFVIALRAKGETASEVAGLVSAMLRRAAPLARPAAATVVDTCGTGGDGARTVNLSTMAALVVAGAGLTVVKHGNRAASSRCGSADLLEELGVVIDLPPAGVQRCVEGAGAGFCFAPVFHPAFRHASGPRRELGVPTVFNVLGPLTNPAHPNAQLVGVADLRLAPVIAGVLAARGTSALVVHATDGLDELSATVTNQIWLVREGEVTALELDPRPLLGGAERQTAAIGGDAALTGGDAAHNAAVCRAFLAGERGAVRDAVLLNAAAALVAASPAASAPRSGEGLAGAIAAQLLVAARSVDEGHAAAALERWVQVSRSAAAEVSGALPPD